MVKALVLLCAALLTSLTQAEQSLTKNGYEIHYNAFNSSFITPEVAQKNGLTRSKVLALLNVSVLKVDANGGKTPVTAIISGEARNLLQQIKPLEFTKIDEGNAIYYLSSFRFSDEELLNFVLKVQPDPNMSPIEVRFSQTFYEDR
ncbi:MAG TPA: DUF4426 domain-containing protein [Marinobacterium sp.]|nr:DUF4426 domain-containing protein [Marinobacterium sp.]